jgi:D-alanyl-D-alanine carboxypeptidase
MHPIKTRTSRLKKAILFFVAILVLHKPLIEGGRIVLTYVIPKVGQDMSIAWDVLRNKINPPSPLTINFSLAEFKHQQLYTVKDKSPQIRVSAKSFFVADLETGDVILAYNAEEERAIASVSKLLTAVVAVELIPQKDFAKVSERALATYGKNGNFSVGEKIQNVNLLFPLLLESSNDAAEIIAEQLNRKNFMLRMNEKVLELGMIHSRFEDPSGLSPNNISTARDLFALVQHIYKEKSYLLDISRISQYKTSRHVWFTHNQFLREDGYIGGKSGFTNPAKQTNIAVFKRTIDGQIRPFAVVILGSDNRYADTMTVVRFIEKHVSLTTRLPLISPEIIESDSPYVH